MLALALGALPAVPQTFDRVVHISVDGLHSGAIAALGRSAAPNFYRLMDDGAYTLNARTDALFTSTLPNHVSQLTGRGVLGSDGHQWIINSDPGPPTTIHILNGDYVSSIFDVVHDAGGSTALYAAKSKFAIFDRSWDGTNGAPDAIGADDGRDKVDLYFFDDELDGLSDRVLADLSARPHDYTFIHFREPDSVGHDSNWDLTAGSAYLGAVALVDREIGWILDVLNSAPEAGANTAIIVTSDHGGRLGSDNHPPGNLDSARIPFFLAGAGLPGGDLYRLTTPGTGDPGDQLPDDDDPVQPIRNGDAANLAASLLGLSPVPGSTMDALVIDGIVAGSVVARRVQAQKGTKLRIRVRVSAREELAVRARGKINAKGGFKLRPKTKSLVAGQILTLRLALKRDRDRRRVIEKLDKGKSVDARIRVRLTDAEGNVSKEVLKVVLRR